MGMEIDVRSLDDMCLLMCDNVIPEYVVNPSQEEVKAVDLKGKQEACNRLVESRRRINDVGSKARF